MTWDVDVASRKVVTICWVLMVPVIFAFPPVMVDVVRERTFATVCPRGKAKVLMMFHVVAFFEATVRDA
jgi:hypothetical protein